jgi:hypothetical protein
MKRFITMLLAASAGIACGGGGDTEETKATSLELRGTYRAQDDGPIASIAFANGKEYVLERSGCAACSESGTYRLDAPAHALLLEDGITHATRTLSFDVLKASGGGGMLAPRDALVGGGEKLVTTGNQLVETVDEMLAESQLFAREGK